MWYGQENDECLAILQCCGRQESGEKYSNPTWGDDVVLALLNFSEWHKNLVSYVLINMWACVSEKWCVGTWSWGRKKCLHKCRRRSKDMHLAVGVSMPLRLVGVWKFKWGLWIGKDEGLKGEHSWCGCVFRMRACYFKRRLDDHTGCFR